ncbi:MAG: glycosyltransferase family 2 protein [Bacteroidia bacterium]|nr:glycosyltransferase family 2 protein [Bacteroidia bacterium]
MQKIKIVLPAYNEEESLPELLKEIDFFYSHCGLNLEVIVVNDGSKDNTAGVVNNFPGKVPVRLLDFKENGGLGKVIKDGLFEAVKDLEDTDVVVTLDADNSQNPNLIKRMVSQIHEGSELVIASRYREGSRILGLTRFRKFTSFMAGSIFMVFVGIEGVKDYTCGFRAYKASLLKRGIEKYGDKLIEERGFGCMIEILLKLNTLKPVINEVPMILRYDLKQGDSKMNVSKTIKQTLNILKEYLFGNRFK